MNWKEKLVYGAIIFVIVSTSIFYLTPVQTAPVQGTSMMPTINDGDAVIIIPTNRKNIRVGDIIAFKPEPDRKVIHRVIALENGRIRTRGDNSEGPDSWIKPSQVVGEHFFTVPHGGIFMDLANSSIAFVLLIVIPSAVIIYNEGRKIKNELRDDQEAK